MESQVAISDADETEGDGRRLREGMGDGQRDRATTGLGGDGGCALRPEGGAPSHVAQVGPVISRTHLTGCALNQGWPTSPDNEAKCGIIHYSPG